jgi:hypothetical protein
MEETLVQNPDTRDLLGRFRFGCRWRRSEATKKLSECAERIRIWPEHETQVHRNRRCTVTVTGLGRSLSKLHDSGSALQDQNTR